MRVLVTGATGTVGSRVVPLLLARDATVRILTHSPEKKGSAPDEAEVAVGDLSERDSLDEAFEGVDRLFLVTPLAPEGVEEEMGRNAVDAAAEAGVERAVFLSVHRVEEGRHIPHFASKMEIAGALAGSGIPHTVLEPNNFYQNDEWVSGVIVENHVYPQPIGNVGCSRVDVADIADCAATALLEDGHTGKAVPVVGPDALTGEACARHYGEALGAEVAYAGDDLDAWAEGASQMMPEWLVDDLRIMYDWFQTEGLVASDDDHARMHALLGHPPRSFSGWVGDAVRRWTGGGS